MRNVKSTGIWDVIVIGGGAAGFFAAITAAETNPALRILILEKGKECLQKVRISGGGRCNVTHACWDPFELATNYPRGGRELRGPFTRFGPQDTVEWFAKRGVRLKAEADGRMFPATDRSETIIDCLVGSAERAGVKIRTSTRVDSIERREGESASWLLRSTEGDLQARKLFLATGSTPAVWRMLAGWGLKIVDPVPSLFTFQVKHPLIDGLAGLSVPMAALSVQGVKGLTARGPLLITHWGLSGPGVLRLSAWGARQLHELEYRFTLRVDWNADRKGDVGEWLDGCRVDSPRKGIVRTPPPGMPSRLWERMLQVVSLPEGRCWAEVRKQEKADLTAALTATPFQVVGKSTFKEEFVTAGGVDLKEMDFRNFAARRFPDLWMAGEMLDIDAITGGFNFQAAWTGGWIAGHAMAQYDETPPERGFGLYR